MINESFKDITDIIKEMVTNTQLDIMVDANKKLINLYYNIGKNISDNYKWGNKFVDYLAMKLKNYFPNLKGFSVRNLKYMKALDEQTKDDSDNSSIGIILCQNKSNKNVDYTLKYINKPVGVSEYKIFDKLSSDLQEKLPTEAEINMHLNIEEE